MPSGQRAAVDHLVRALWRRLTDAGYRMAADANRARRLRVRQAGGVIRPDEHDLDRLGRALYGTSLGSIGLCVVLWIRAKTVGEDERGNAERRALFVGLWPPMFWLMGDTARRDVPRRPRRRRVRRRR
jgi:hypothetical protein